VSYDGSGTNNVSPRRERFVSGCGLVVLILGFVLLLTSHDGRSVASSSTSVLLGGGLLTIAPGRSRPWLRKVTVAAFLLAIALAI